MIHFHDIDAKTFLKDYWQKRPLLIKQALPNFITPLSPEELAGLSLEEEVESRLVIQKGEQDYELLNGPFDETTYANLPEDHWTLLVQGVDRLVPEVTALLDEFNFIPQWRIDDIMISYATVGGNVGPHFDHYDVFLLQGRGQREWTLTSQDCTMENYLDGVPLRLMQRFEVEERYLVEPGDVLYVPPKWGHHGIGLTDDCMTYSIGYRSYRGQELWDSYGDHLSENQLFQTLYQDPDWSSLEDSAEVNADGAEQARQLLQSALEDTAENQRMLQTWFGRFATQLDPSAVSQLPDPLTEEEQTTPGAFAEFLMQTPPLMRNPVCRFAFSHIADETVLFVNGNIEPNLGADQGCIRYLADTRFYDANRLLEFFTEPQNQPLILHFWHQQYMELLEH
jgi:50S ribosomal protein L16 3-hydroxylase